MNEKKTIRNPSAEEIENITKGRVSKIVNPPSQYTPREVENIMNMQNSDETSKFFGVPMKKIDEFEPSPLKFKLPSGGKVVTSGLTEDNEIFVRRFSTEEESLLSKIKQKEEFFSTINDILDNCIKSKIHISMLSEIDKIPLIMFIIAISYGSEYNMAPVDGCKTCTPETKNIIDLIDSLEIVYVPDDFVYPLVMKLKTYKGADIEMAFHFPRIMNESVIFKNNTETFAKQMKSILVYIEGTKKNGQPVTTKDHDNILKYLEEEDKLEISNMFSRFSKHGLIKYETYKYKCSNDHCEMKINKMPIDISLEKVFRNITEKINSKKIDNF